MSEPTVTRTIRLTESLLDRVGQISTSDGVSVNRLITDAIERRINEIELARGIETGDALAEIEGALGRLRESMKKVQPSTISEAVADPAHRAALMASIQAHLGGDR